MDNPRYARQAAYLDRKSQERVRGSSVATVGIGMTGSMTAAILVRAGLGNILVIDRDFVENENLGNSALFTENDVGRPKAVAAYHRLNEINAGCKVRPVSDELNQKTIGIMEPYDIILDCTDNMYTRHLINEFCIKNKKPWIYSGAIGMEGMGAVFQGSPCLKCLFPKQDGIETCETAGVLQPAASLISSWQAAQALKLMAGMEIQQGRLFSFSLMKNEFAHLKIPRNPRCPVCAKGEYRLLGMKSYKVTRLCGLNSYHISPSERSRVNMDDLAKRLGKKYETSNLHSVIHVKIGTFRVSIFENSRAIVSGVGSEKEAESIYRKISRA